MGEQRNILLAILGVIVFALIFLFYVWRQAFNAPRSLGEEKETTFPSSDAAAFRQDLYYFPPPRGYQVFQSEGSLREEAGFPLLPGSLPESPSFPDFLIRGREFLEETFKPPATKTTSVSPSSPLPQRVMSEEEIFNTLWPKSYLENLRVFEDVMHNDGFITEAERHTVIDSEEDIYAVLLKMLDYTEAKQWIPAGDIAKLRQGLLGDFKKMKDRERELLREPPAEGPTSSLPQFPRPFLSSKEESSRTFIVSSLLNALSILSLPEAEADAPWWHTLLTGSSDCYKDEDEDFKPLGPNLWAACCNCGLTFDIEFGTVFNLDCGPFSVFCDIPLGCLNLVCIDWPNAIWDAFWYPNGMGICGCG